MMRLLICLAAVAAAQAAIAEDLPSIDWGSAGKGEAASEAPLAETPPPPGEEGFDCRTVTRFDDPVGRIGRTDPSLKPSQVRRCSREGFSFEVTPPDNP